MRFLNTVAKIIIPLLAILLFIFGKYYVYYAFGSNGKVECFSDFIRTAIRYVLFIAVLFLIYQTVYVKNLGATKYNLEFPPIKLVIAFVMIEPFLLLAMQHFSFLFVQLKGGVFVVDTNVESEWGSLLFNTLLVVLFGPICEELVMRVMMISQAQTHKGIFIAVILSSLLFSLIHMDYSALRFIARMLNGILYSLLLICTNNIWYPIMYHAAYNLSVSCMGFIQYFNPSLIETDVVTGLVRANRKVTIIFAIIFLGGVLLLLKNKATISLIIRERTNKK